MLSGLSDIFNKSLVGKRDLRAREGGGVSYIATPLSFVLAHFSFAPR
jgi:hypothetical protein